MNTQDVIRMIREERKRQDERWGGPAHDDQHTLGEWSQYLIEHALKAITAPPGSLEQQRRIVEVAALGRAIAEVLDRKTIYERFSPIHGDSEPWFG